MMTVSVLDIKYNYPGKTATFYLAVLHNNIGMALVDILIFK